ncbi:unnamed protein product [Amoebophrya sp. A25]|nr:unnamed protein product [Amoebophrya sp. A25]|eukprot:GSA25T00017693001.1
MGSSVIGNMLSGTSLASSSSSGGAYAPVATSGSSGISAGGGPTSSGVPGIGVPSIGGNPFQLNQIGPRAKVLGESFIRIALAEGSNHRHKLALGITVWITLFSLLAMVWGDVVFCLGLAPRATVFSPVSDSLLPIPFFWNVLTWHALDTSKVLVTAPFIYWALKELESVFAGPLVLTSHLVFNLLLGSMFAFGVRLLQGDTVEPLFGTGCLCVILSMMLANRFPAKEVPLARGRYFPLRKLPSATLLGLVVLAIVTPTVPEFGFCLLQLPLTWTYLRFFAIYPSGRQGDRNFKLSELFPSTKILGLVSLKPALDVLSAGIYLALVKAGCNLSSAEVLDFEEEDGDLEIEYGANNFNMNAYHYPGAGVSIGSAVGGVRGSTGRIPSGTIPAGRAVPNSGTEGRGTGGLDQVVDPPLMPAIQVGGSSASSSSVVPGGKFTNPFADSSPGRVPDPGTHVGATNSMTTAGLQQGNYSIRSQQMMNLNGGAGEYHLPPGGTGLERRQGFSSSTPSDGGPGINRGGTGNSAENAASFTTSFSIVPPNTSTPSGSHTSHSVGNKSKRPVFVHETKAPTTGQTEYNSETPNAGELVNNLDADPVEYEKRRIKALELLETL